MFIFISYLFICCCCYSVFFFCCCFLFVYFFVFFVIDLFYYIYLFIFFFFVLFSVYLFPVGIWCQNDVSTLMRHHHVVSAMIRRHFTTCVRWVVVSFCYYFLYLFCYCFPTYSCCCLCLTVCFIYYFPTDFLTFFTIANSNSV